MKCEAGHETGLRLYCSVCGKPVSYKSEVDVFSRIPKVKVVSERIAILSMGLKRPEARESYATEVRLGDRVVEGERELTLKTVFGGSWLEYYREYAEKLRTWLNIILYDVEQPRLAVVDLSNPISVSLLRSLPENPKTVVAGVVDDETKAVMVQNLNFVSLHVLEKKMVPSIIVSRGLLKRLGFYVKGKGMLMGEEALAHVLSKACEVFEDVLNFMMLDAKFGVWAHTMAPLFTASDKIYSTPSNCIEVLSHQTLLNIPQKQVRTAYLLAWMGEGFSEAREEFLNYVEKAFGHPLSVDARNFAREDIFSDLLALYGVSARELFEAFREGYEESLKNVPDIGVEAIKW